MAAGLSTPAHMHCIQHIRFTKQDGWLLNDLSLSLCGNIAVTGRNENTHRTSIDVYAFVKNSDSRDKPKILCSKEFEKYESEDGWTYRARMVSFVDSYDESRSLVIVTGLGDKLEVFDLNQDRVLKSRKVPLFNHGWITCLSVREREIFTGFRGSNKITVYDVTDLNEIKSINLQGIQDGYWPGDMTAIADRLFVCEVNRSDESIYRSLIFDPQKGKMLSQLTNPSDTCWYTESVTVCVPLGVVAVVWYDSYYYTEGDSNQIAFYSLFSKNKSSFLIVEVEFGVYRIRISDRGDRMVTMNYSTGEVKVYHMAEFFTYSQLKENLASQLQTDDCWNLANFLGLPKDETDATLQNDKPTESFLLALEEKCLLQPADVDRLTEAFTELKISSSCNSLVNFYQNTRKSALLKGTIQKLQEENNVLQNENQQLKKQLETADRKAEESKIQVHQLQKNLEETAKRLQEITDLHQKAERSRDTFRAERDEYQMQHSRLMESFESSKQELLQTKELFEKLTHEKNAIKAELEQYKLQSSMKSVTLGDDAAGSLTKTTKSGPLEIENVSRDSVSSPTSEYFSESVIAQEFSKLLVKVSVNLNNDHCVLLAIYFNFPESKIDEIGKGPGSPGITLLRVMKERNIINMYDVTRMQKALVDIELREINESILKPYQRRIDPTKYQQNEVIQQDF